MPFQKPGARRPRWIPIWMLLAAGLSACVQAPPVLPGAMKCSDLIPDDWYTKGVASADLPADSTAGGWVSFGVAQTGQLDKANNQTRDSHAIVAKCEANNAAALAAFAPKPWWHFW